MVEKHNTLYVNILGTLRYLCICTYLAVTVLGLLMI